MTKPKDTKPSPASVHRSPSLLHARATGTVAAGISRFEEAAKDKDKENVRPGATPGRAKGKKWTALATHQEEPSETPGTTTPKKDATRTPDRQQSLLRSALRGSPFRGWTPARPVPSLPATPEEDNNNNSKSSDPSDPFSFIPKSSLSSSSVLATPEQRKSQLTRVDSPQSESKSKPLIPFGSLSSRLAGIRSRFSPSSHSAAKATSLIEDNEVSLPIQVKATAARLPSDNSAFKSSPFRRVSTDNDNPPPTPPKEPPTHTIDSTPSKASWLSHYSDNCLNSPGPRRPSLVTSASDNSTGGLGSSRPSQITQPNDNPVTSPRPRRPELTSSTSSSWFTRNNENQVASSFFARSELSTRVSADTPSKSRLTKLQCDSDPPSPTPVANNFTTGRFGFLTSNFSQFTRGNNDVENPFPVQQTSATRPLDTTTKKANDTFAPPFLATGQRKESSIALCLDKSLPSTPELTTSSVAPSDRPQKKAVMAEGTTPEGGFVVPRLADILRTPEDLDKIPALKAEYERKKAAVDAQLREGLREQLESVQRGMAALAEGQRQVAKTRDELQNIDKLCRESQSTVGDFAQIDRLAKINRNFEAVIMMKKRLEEFPNDLAQLENLLKEDDENMQDQPNLLPAHMAVSRLRDFRDEAMDQIRRANNKDYEAQLIELFRDLDPAIEWFEEHIGTLCMNLIPLIQEGKNGIVTRLAVVIRKEELNDEQVRALQEAQKDHKGLATRFRSMNIGPKTVRGYKEKLLKSIELYAQNQFEETKEKFLEDPDKLPKHFRWFFNDLMAVQQGMQRCMPKKWKIYKTYTNIYHKLMHDWLIEFIDDPQLPAANMLAIVHWVEKYYEKMAKLGWNQADLVPHVVDEREGELVRDWRNLIVKALDEWMDRMFTTDKNSFLERDADALDHSADGYFRTKTLGDMWRMIHEQLMAAGASERTDVAEGVVDAMFQALKHRQSAWQTMLDEECARYKSSPTDSDGLLPLQDWLIAVANDQIACIDDNDDIGSLGYLTRFRRDLEPLVTQKYLASRVEPEIDALRNGYVDFGTHCISLFIDLIFSVDFRTTLPDIFTQKWYSEFAMKRMITTFEDYLTDYNNLLDPSLRDILIEEIADELLVHYLSAIRNKGAKFRRQDPFTDKFKDDVITAFNFFGQFPEMFEGEGGIKARWRSVDYLVRLLEAEKGPGVVAMFDTFKTEFWDLQMSWVEAVLRSRDDFERSMLSAVKAKAAEMNVERGPESIMSKVR